MIGADGTDTIVPVAGVEVLIAMGGDTAGDGEGPVGDGLKKQAAFSCCRTAMTGARWVLLAAIAGLAPPALQAQEVVLVSTIPPTRWCRRFPRRATTGASGGGDTAGGGFRGPRYQRGPDHDRQHLGHRSERQFQRDRAYLVHALRGPPGGNTEIWVDFGDGDFEPSSATLNVTYTDPDEADHAPSRTLWRRWCRLPRSRWTRHAPDPT